MVFIASESDGANMRQLNGTVLFQVTVCRFVGTKPLREPIRRMWTRLQNEIFRPQYSNEAQYILGHITSCFHKRKAQRYIY